MAFSDKRILIGDGDEENARMLAERCRGLGLQVQIAFDGLTALTSFAFAEPDIACIDAQLVGSRGERVCDTIVTDTLRGSAPLIAMLPAPQEDCQTPFLDRPDQRTYTVCKGDALWEQVERLLRKLLVDEGLLAAVGV